MLGERVHRWRPDPDDLAGELRIVEGPATASRLREAGPLNPAGPELRAVVFGCCERRHGSRRTCGRRCRGDRRTKPERVARQLRAATRYRAALRAYTRVGRIRDRLRSARDGFNVLVPLLERGSALRAASEALYGHRLKAASGMPGFEQYQRASEATRARMCSTSATRQAPMRSGEAGGCRDLPTACAIAKLSRGRVRVEHLLEHRRTMRRVPQPT